MARKTPADTPDTSDAAPDFAPVPGENFHAHLAPVSAPQLDAATDDPAHPLHHHAKRDSLESPEPAKD